MQHPYQKRRRKLRAAVKKSGANALLVTNIKNISYLTGFSGSAGSLIVTPKTEILLSDTRYSTQIQDECPEIEVAIRDAQSTMMELTQATCQNSKLKSLAYESDSLKKSEFDQLESALAGIELIPTRGWIENLRAIKDKSEIEAIRNSIDINQRAFNVIQAQLTSAQSELQIAHNLEHQMRAFGAKGCAFEPIVSVGTRSALPHGQPTATSVSESQFLLIDWGAEVNHYLSDLTRMIFTGKIPTKIRKIYNVVLKAQLAAIKKIRPGQSFQAIDQAARKVIETAGFGPHFGHGTGHSFGLEIHEQPYMSPIHKGLLEAGMVITIEPGIYLPNIGGVRIEDDVLVTPDGHEVLSNLPKQIDECTVDLGG